MSNQNPPSGGPPLRALAMVLIALAIVFGGLGALSLSKSDSGDSSANAVSPSVAPQSGGANTPAGSAAPASPPAAAPTTGASPSAGAIPSAAGEGSVDKTVAVRVLNNSSITGLAAKTADELKAAGWNVAETGNYSDGVIPKTTVYYSDSAGEKRAAEEIADTIGASAQQRFAGIANSSAGVIVIVTQ